MLFRVKGKNNKSNIVKDRAAVSVGAIAAGATIFALVLAAPVTVDLAGSGADLVVPAAAHAKGDRGGGRGGGNGGGRGGGNGGGKGGGAGGGNGGGNAGGNGGGKGGTSGGGGGGSNSGGGGNSGGGNGGGGNGGGGNGGGGNGGGDSGADTGGASNDGDRESHRARQPTVPTVAVAVFTTAIKKRYPANDVATLDDPQQAISFFNELHAMAGKRITHRWMHEGSVMFEAKFDVLAQRWRIWSTQFLPADQAGEWTVEIVDEDGNVLERHSLNYQPKDPDLLAMQ